MPRTTFDGRKNVQVNFQPNIGLDAASRQSVVDILNILLADEAVLSRKTRLADGNSSEDRASNLHSIFGAQSRQIQEIMIEIEERVNILGGTHPGESEELIDSPRLDGRPVVVSETVSILADFEAFIRFLREDARKCSELYEDQGSFALLVGVMRQHEKMAWMLRAFIEPELVQNANP